MPNRNSSLDSIAQHVAILNEELGLVKIDVGELKNDFKGVKTDIKWLKKLIGYMAALFTGVFISVLGAAIKYMFLS